MAAVLSGNRNFEGRIHPQVRAAYLASPPLVVAFALAGRVDIDLTTRAPGHRLGWTAGDAGRHLADVGGDPRGHRRSVDAEMFRRTYAVVFEGDERWRALPIPTGDRYAWEAASTYVAQAAVLRRADPRAGAASRTSTVPGCSRVLGDSVTTDHISPAGSIATRSPAGQWLQEHGVAPLDFNSYGARRGHHEVMMRGTFGNIRLRNALVAGQGGAVHAPPARRRGGASSTTPRCATATRACRSSIIAGREYGSGLVARLGREGHGAARRPGGDRRELRAHPPLEPRRAWASCRCSSCRARAPPRSGLTGRERYTIAGLEAGLQPRQQVTVVVATDDGRAASAGSSAIARLDGPIEVGYCRHGGILPAVLRRLAAS